MKDTLGAKNSNRLERFSGACDKRIAGSRLMERAKEIAESWLAGHSLAVLRDEASSRLFDVASGKSVYLPWSKIAAIDERIHPDTQDAYLAMMLEDGTQIALVDPGGIAFAPSTVNSGPVDNLPPVVCLRDFLTLKQRVDHYLYEHPEEPPPRECLDLIMICIAILDGARLVGFDVGDLEEALEKSLNELEQRKG